MDSSRRDLPGLGTTKAQIWFELVTQWGWIPVLVVVVVVLAVKTVL